MTDQAFSRFKQELKKQSGLDLDLYKENQINRRLLSYMQRHSISDFGGLCSYIANKDNVSHLVDYLDINVSEFFRNPELFVYLEQEVFSKLMSKVEGMKIWSAGCSIGAEPYSIAVAALETRVRNPAIWATDLDAGALQQASKGEYSLGDIRNVLPGRVEKYFEVNGNNVKVKTAAKALVKFSRHDLLRDAIPGTYDLIVCRNVAIYFTEEAKSAMLERFAKTLNPGGILFTGATESYPGHREFGLNRIHTCFYQKGGA